MSELTIGGHYAKTRRTVSHSSGVCKFEIRRPGEECLPSERPFDLAIVDVNMPMMDGYSFLHALRREPLTPAVPALMTSTEAGPEDHRAALQAGANGYLVKPVPRDQFALYVAAMLGRNVA